MQLAKQNNYYTGKSFVIIDAGTSPICTKRLREFLGLTQGEFSKKIDKPKYTVKKWEKDGIQKIADCEMIKSLAKAEGLLFRN